MRYNKILLKQFDEAVRDFTTFGSLYFYMLIIIITFLINVKQSLILIIGLILIEFIGSIIKLFFHKTRPNQQAYSNTFEKIDAGSFPSIHAARALITALVLYPLFSSSIVVGIIFTVVLLTGISRILLKKHFIIDVIGGYLFGFICWYIAAIII